jgi:hypothetical protein
MPSRLITRLCLTAIVGAFLLGSTPTALVHAQPAAKRLFDDANVDQKPSKRHIPTHRARNVKAHLDALKDSDVVLNLFDDLQLTVHKTKVERYLTDHFVWHGRTDDGDIVTLALVRGVMTGMVTANGQTFEITPDADGTYVVNELDSAAFPTDDPVGMDIQPALTGPDVALDVTGGSASTLSTGGDTTGTVIDAMVVWTPAARNAVGGSTDAIQSLVLAAVANANLAYANSGVNAQLRLVYSGEVSYTETPSSILTDLTALATNGDGKIDQVHALRAQYGADVVTLIGNGYAGAGACGIGYLMTAVSTSFTPYAFNVVDQSCAAGYLSYAHEVGHNEGLQHDPANAGSSPSYPYAYGYQDPGGRFRTVLSYGGATRIPYFSSPLVTYNGVPTGTSTQDNARALRSNVATVSNFVSSTVGGSTNPPVSQPCTYAVSSSALTFSAASGSSSLSVTTDSTCGWTTSSGASWISVTAGMTGSGTVTVSVSPNTGADRTGTVTVAGVPVTVTQKAPVPCSFALSTTSLTFNASSASAGVTVTTGSGCSWTTSSGASWIAVTAGKTGSSTATVSVISNTGALRTGSATIAGRAVAITQKAPTVRGKSGK